jgi:hypothetical protein
LRKAETRTRKALIEAMGAAISAVTDRGCTVSSNTAGTVFRFSHYDQL